MTTGKTIILHSVNAILWSMKSNPELRARIVELYDGGNISIDAVAKQVGLTSGTVFYHLHKANSPMRKQGSNFKTRLGAMAPRLAPLEHPRLLDIPWAAGCFEGEGSTIIDRRENNVSVMALLVQKDRWLCDRYQALFGGSVTAHVQHPSANPKPITMHYWRLTGPRARGFLMTIYKFLSPRRQQRIREALAA